MCCDPDRSAGLEDYGSKVRVGPTHYNTLEEIKRFGEALGRIVAGKLQRYEII